MGSLLSRSVEIQISNNTRNITLRNPRTFFECGRCSKPPVPELFPGSSDTCHFAGSSPFWGVAGVLAYEADSFTLAIHFSNPMDYNKYSMELGLELSPGKAHLGKLETTYARMAHGTYSSSCPDTKFTRVILDQSHGTARLSHGPVRVMATMSSDTRATLKVVLQEERGSGAEAGREEPWDVKGDTSRRRENLRDLLRDLRESPGSTWTA
ncbi:uncharacterized protein LOC119696756 [Motacilla alba alba]|uniref:uncharacterized protein LOC119696756 n=1 Tax=Motacilla alba alba TaxID=1094192 RepID=UPI0018D51CA8|nr:uncharacterized protein LOC119696756 [Motacilla alba alba]XP_037982523.1 uncharacterized protein LOC119696756 [Motacilla alba alba]